MDKGIYKKGDVVGVYFVGPFIMRSMSFTNGELKTGIVLSEYPQPRLRYGSTTRSIQYKVMVGDTKYFISEENLKKVPV